MHYNIVNNNLRSIQYTLYIFSKTWYNEKQNKILERNTCKLEM